MVHGKCFVLASFCLKFKRPTKLGGQIAKKPLESLIALIGRYSLVLWFLGDHVVWLAKLKVFPTLVTPHEKYFKQRSWQFRTIGYACCMVLEYFAALKKAADKGNNL